MKKILLIALFFLTGRFCFSFDSNLIFSSKLSLPLLESKVYLEKDFNTKKIIDDYSFAFASSLQKRFPRLPFTIKLGKLSHSGALSLLNSPSLSANLSPFFNCRSEASPIISSLPGNSSFSKPLSFALQMEIKNKKAGKIFKFNSIYIPENNHTFATSIFTSLSLRNKTKIQLSACGGIFPYSNYKNTSWFSNYPFYHEDKIFSSNLNLALINKDFATRFISSMYISPFGDFFFTFRNENNFKFRAFSFNIQEFFNSNQRIITSNNKILEPNFQIKAGIQHSFLAGKNKPIFVKTGSSLYFDYNLLAEEKIHTIKNAYGIKMISTAYTGNLIFNINLALKEDEKSINLNYEKISLNIKNYFYTKKINPFIKVNLSLEPNSNYTKVNTEEKISLGFTIPGKNSLSLNSSIAFYQRDFHFDKIAFENSISFLFQIKKISCTLKVGAGW